MFALFLRTRWRIPRNEQTGVKRICPLSDFVVCVCVFFYVRSKFEFIVICVPHDPDAHKFRVHNCFGVDCVHIMYVLAAFLLSIFCFLFSLPLLYLSLYVNNDHRHEKTLVIYRFMPFGFVQHILLQSCGDTKIFVFSVLRLVVVICLWVCMCLYVYVCNFILVDDIFSTMWVCFPILFIFFFFAVRFCFLLSTPCVHV